MKNKILLPLLFLALLFSSSCTKKDTVNELYPKQNTRSDIVNPIGPVLVISDAVLTQNFASSVEAVPNLSLNSLYTISHQSPEYAQILSSSVSILKQANILDALKISLGILTDDDPKIIIAAMLIDNIYKIPRPIIEGSTGSDILKCALAALGVPLTSMTTFVGSMTMAEIGTAIYAMGFKWFAGAVLKVGLRGASGAGLAIMVAQFTFCMVWGSSTPTIAQLAELAPNVDIFAPPTPSGPVNPTYNYTTTQFNDYIEAVKSWAVIQAGGLNGVAVPNTFNKENLKYFINLFNRNTSHPVHLLQNDSRFQTQLTSYIEKDYFNSSVIDPSPIPH